MPITVDVRWKVGQIDCHEYDRLYGLFGRLKKVICLSGGLENFGSFAFLCEGYDGRHLGHEDTWGYVDAPFDRHSMLENLYDYFQAKDRKKFKTRLKKFTLRVKSSFES